MVDIVLEERHLVGHAERVEAGLQQRVASEIVRNHVAQVETLGRRIFEMPHVEVQAGRR